MNLNGFRNQAPLGDIKPIARAVPPPTGRPPLDETAAAGLRSAMTAAAAPETSAEVFARELAAMHACLLELQSLKDDASRKRALRWVFEVLHLKDLQPEAQ